MKIMPFAEALSQTRNKDSSESGVYVESIFLQSDEKIINAFNIWR